MRHGKLCTKKDPWTTTNQCPSGKHRMRHRCFPIRIPKYKSPVTALLCEMLPMQPLCVLRLNRHRGNNVNFSNYTEVQIEGWLLPRAAGWVAAFLSQPLAPIMFIFFPSYWVIAAISMLGVLLSLIRCFCVNMTIATTDCCMIVWAKWAPAIVSAIYFTKRSRNTQNIRSFQRT